MAENIDSSKKLVNTSNLDRFAQKLDEHIQKDIGAIIDVVEQLNDFTTSELDKKQDKTDENLNTQDKTIVGALNELELEMFEAKAELIALDEYKLEQEDLPCYDTREYKSITLTYDGNQEGKETVDAGEGTFVKLTSDVSIHDLDGLRFSTITLYATDGTQEEIGDMVFEGEYIIVQENVYAIGSDFANIMLVLEDTELIDYEVSMQKGLWISHISIPNYSINFYIKSLTYNKCVSGELKKLDEKYLEKKPGICSEGKIYTYTIFDDPDERTTEIEVTHVGESGAESFNKVGEHESIAIGACSHAEGADTIAYGYASHSEGCENVALGSYSHVEGLYTYALGAASHAEGSGTSAMRESSHAEGSGTIAYGDAQHVQGKHNIKDTEDKYAHIVGNGSSKEERSNAHTLDWNGNAWFAGDVTTGADNKKLATEAYVTDIIKENLITKTIAENKVTLTIDKRQKVEMVDGTEIVLPTVTDFTEIHLYFSTLSDLTLIFPAGKYQKTPEIKANKTYEFIFTYVGEWLIGYVEYGN